MRPDYIKNPTPTEKKPRNMDFYIPQEQKIQAQTAQVEAEQEKVKKEIEELKESMKVVRKKKPGRPKKSKTE